MKLKVFWQSPKFFEKAGVFVKLGSKRIRVFPVW
jgi:hypothetical protein